MLVKQLRKKGLKKFRLEPCSTILFPVRQLLTADFERVSIVCALAGAADKNTKRLFSASN